MADTPETLTLFSPESCRRNIDFFERVGALTTFALHNAGVSRETIDEVRVKMGDELQQLMDDMVTIEDDGRQGAVVLGHQTKELTPLLGFDGGVFDTLDEIDPQFDAGIQGKLMLLPGDTWSSYDYTVIPGGFYSDFIDHQLFVCDGDGAEYDSHAELADVKGAWVEDN